jgi:hypothetical protein
MILTVCLVVVVVVAVCAALARASFVSAQPDEWLVRVRDGRLVQAGVGISTWRRPGELVVRFTSTLQRVGFEVQGLTREQLPVKVEGFVFWSVAAEGDAPFRAFRQLGLANLCRPPADLKHPKHLFTGPQHRAFQQLILATVQRHVAALDLATVLFDQDTLLAGLRDRLDAEMHPLGIQVDQAQVTQARPADAAVLANLSAAEEERIREQAAQVRLEARERSRRREIAVETALAEAESAARSAREASEASARLDAERAAARQLEERLRLQRDAADARQAEALLECARKEALALREEAARLAHADARRRRREVGRAFALEGLRARALARRDAARALAQAEEEKSVALREVELRGRIADRVAESLKVTDGRWVSIGSESPAASLAGVMTALGGALGVVGGEERATG